MKAKPTKTKSWRRFGRLWGAVLALSLTGAATAANAAADDDAPPPLPEGAVEVGEGIYQVPVGRDDDGCAMYQLHAPGQAVIQVISYRRADGAFTTDKSEADCGDTSEK